MSLRDMVKSYSTELATATVATHKASETTNVAKVAGVAVADAQNEILRFVERWQWFLSLATKYGIDPCVVGAEFPATQDQLDVIEPPEHDDDILRACMATLCSDVRVRQRQENFDNGQWEPVE